MADKKRTGPLNWDDVRYFAALARHGSLSAAARHLRVNHATVARRLAALEAHLGQLLFDRHLNGYSLTAAGRRVLAASGRMEEAVADLQADEIDPASPTGLVRLTTLRSFADGFLVSRLGDLSRQYPGIELQVIAESRNLSLDRNEVDLALRFGRPKSGGFLARRIGSLDFCLYATRAVKEDARGRLITFDEASNHLPEAQFLHRRMPGRAIALRSNSQASQAVAAAAGMGIAVLPCYLARQFSALEVIDSRAGILQREIWLLIRKDQRQQPRIKLVADFLVTCLRAGQPALNVGPIAPMQP